MKIASLEARLRDQERYQSRERTTHTTQLQNVTDEAMRMKREAQERETQHQQDIAELRSQVDKGKGREPAATAIESDADDEEDEEDEEEDGLFNMQWYIKAGGTDDEMDHNVDDHEVCPKLSTQALRNSSILFQQPRIPLGGLDTTMGNPDDNAGVASSTPGPSRRRTYIGRQEPSHTAVSLIVGPVSEFCS